MTAAEGSEVRAPWASRAIRFFAQALPLSYFKKPPTIIVVDVTNSCNLRCPVCPVTIAMTRKRGLMKIEVFKKIIDDFKSEREKPAMYFNFSGEPTLNPALPEFIAYSHENGHETFLSTNATKLTVEMAERLILAGLGRVYLCMDGFSKEAQESYRVNSDFEEVKANIEMFLATRRRLGVKNPKCVLQTLLTGYSEHQMDDIRAWAESAGFDQIRFKTFSIGSYTSEEEKRDFSRFLPTKEELRRHPTGIQRATCTAPLHQTVVFWNGDLGLCCIDYDQMVQLPNIGAGGFLDAYRSDEAARARKKGYLKQFEICKGCSYSNAENMGMKIDLHQPV
ncbi:MoaA/NifB/PqqE/SkfB family radical SAM enzyme [Rhodoligotrophos appendicifer]|uniref:radical SAM/SPASM domain-containing protein n=1 Tax=Rhodoligotrophos appendicifer TaxID=987056 RepID=UPI00118478B5|nr:radical SAM protein [Rhodoligotrophos appendicifer]